MCFDGLEAGEFAASATGPPLKDATGRLHRAKIVHTLAENRVKAVSRCTLGSTSLV